MMLNIETLKNFNPLYFFLAIYLTSSILGITLSTCFAENFYQYMVPCKIFLKILFVICMFFNIFIYRIYTLKKFIIHSLITIIFIAVSLHLNKFDLLYLVWILILPITGVTFRQISKTALICTSIMLTLIVALTALGIGDYVVYNRFGNLMYFQRFSYGFLNPNTFSLYLFQICLALVYLRWKDFGTKDNLFLLSAFCLTTFCTNSRTTSILIIILTILSNAYRVKLKTITLPRYLANSMLILCPTISFLMAKLYCHSIPFAMWVNELVSYRLRNLCYCMKMLPLSLLGNRVHNYMWGNDLYILDNFYGRLLIYFGIIPFTLFLAAYFLIIKKASNTKNIPLLILLTLGLIQACSESALFSPHMNFTIFAFSYLLNNKEI